MTRRMVLFALGCALGGILFVAGGVGIVPAPASCPKCAVLTHPNIGSESEELPGAWFRELLISPDGTIVEGFTCVPCHAQMELLAWVACAPK